MFTNRVSVLFTFLIVASLPTESTAAGVRLGNTTAAVIRNDGTTAGVSTGGGIPFERMRQDKPQDVAGSWALTVETAQGTGTPTVTFKQDGEKLTGTYSSQVFGEQQVTGTIKGNTITFGFTGSVEGTTIVVTYSGTVEKDSMKGKVTLGELGEGTFTGKKK